MQLIIISNDYEYIYFEITSTLNSQMSLTCPLCNQNGFALDFLKKHSLGTYSILCSICFKRQNNLSEHLNQQRNLFIQSLLTDLLNRDH
jgi:transcription elongation factor Elf1